MSSPTQPPDNPGSGAGAYDELAELAALRNMVKRGELIFAPRYARLLDRIEAVASSTIPVPDTWRNLLDDRGKGLRWVRGTLASILNTVGRWDGHEDIDTLASTVPRPFSTAALADLKAASDQALDLPLLPDDLISIDGPDPVEIDDAIWVHEEGDHAVLTVAIASPGVYVSAGTTLDSEIGKRAATLYHPRYLRPMLPPELLRLSSLDAGQNRPALVTRIRIDATGVPDLVDIRHGLVQVRRAVCYDDVDACVRDRRKGALPAEIEQMLERLLELTKTSENRRIRRGAWLLYRVATEVSCKPFKTPSAIGVDQASPAHRMVGEAMVLGGGAMAQFCIQHNLPVAFRSQPPPKQPPLPPGLYTEPADIRAMIRHMSPANASIHAASHATLGLQAYVQATSPLRRYLDLVAQRQVIAALDGKPSPHTAAFVQKAIRKTQSTMLRYRRSQRRAERYFTLMHLAGLGLGTQQPAQIVPDISRKNRHIAYIEALSVEVDLPGFSGDIGTRVTVVLDEIDVLGGVVRGHVVS